MISPFNLPSDPQKEIHLREATVGDAMEFSDVDSGREEAATTLFLNTVQDKGFFYDSKKWTGEDRRFALAWYFLHTEKDANIRTAYECDHCKKEHVFSFNLCELTDAYINIKGKAQREFVFDGKTITVRPLTGTNLELLEMERLALAEAKITHGSDSGAYRKQEAMIKLRTLVLSCTTPEGSDPMDKIIFSLKMEQAWDLFNAVGEHLVDMRHGLPCEYVDGKIYLISPLHTCPNDPKKEVQTRVRVPFRVDDFIPQL